MSPKNQLFSLLLLILLPLPSLALVRIAPKSYKSMSQPRLPWGFSSGIVNDNFRDYIGADDFKTFSLYTYSQWCRYEFQANWNAFTSRKYKWRYDIAEFVANSQFNLNALLKKLKPGWMYRLGAGFNLKGDLGGSSIQNNWHEWVDVPTVDLPYRDSLQVSPVLTFQLQKTFGNSECRCSQWLFSTDHRYYRSIQPSRGSVSISYQRKLGERFLFQALGGWKWEYQTLEDYSELSDASTFIWGGHLQVKLWSHLFLDMGITMQDAQNLQRDPIYDSEILDYQSQLFLGFSWRPRQELIRRILQF